MKCCLYLYVSMNRAGSLSIKDSAFGCGHFKKPKKKRHRNKFRKNKQKKFYLQKKTNSNNLDPFKFNPDSVKVMSNWYWSNYKKAVEWQDRHKLAHWKACALALMEENRHLLKIISSIQPGMVPNMSVTESHLNESINCNKTMQMENPIENFTNAHTPGSGVYNYDTNEEEDDRVEHCYDYTNLGDEDDDDSDDIEFEMSEEMIQFFEQSYKHKMDLKKLREKELQNKVEEEVKQMQTNKIKRSTEMSLLYGDGASMITGMETAIQLSFDKYCDTKSPKYWPNIPFRL